MRVLTVEQERVVYSKKGLFTVRACPGSGKTYTVAARLARLLSSWKHSHLGIAVVSFTNVAWEEVVAYLSEDFNISMPLKYPHFLGTIDSFINKYIFLPFGHLSMACNERPILTGPPHDTLEPINNWLWWKNYECNRYQCRLNDFSYNVYGELESVVDGNHFSKCRSNHEYCSRNKAIFNRRGYATQADANYFTFKLLKEHPVIASSLAIRFPVIMVDEAQDTSEVQMKIIDILIEHGVKEVMLAGDPDQAIYEWRKAIPSLFSQKFEIWRDNSVEFTDNWRSNQHICNFASRISSLSRTMRAANTQLIKHQGKPEIWTYIHDKDIPQLVTKFLVECEKRHIENKAVLARGKHFLNKISPETHPTYDLTPWREKDQYTKNIALGKFFFDRGKFKEAYQIVERQICVCKYGAPFRFKNLQKIISETGFVEWRSQLSRFLNCLPKTDCILSAWIDKSNNQIRQGAFLIDNNLGIKRDSKKGLYSKLDFEEIFEAPSDRLDSTCYGTVHSIKGKTKDAVLLVLKEKAGDGSYYPKLINCNIQENEELRIIYVAITRPRKYLVIVIPDDQLDDWRKKFTGP